LLRQRRLMYVEQGLEFTDTAGACGKGRLGKSSPVTPYGSRPG
jgi:hypothetical protein